MHMWTSVWDMHLFVVCVHSFCSVLLAFYFYVRSTIPCITVCLFPILWTFRYVVWNLIDLLTHIFEILVVDMNQFVLVLLILFEDGCPLGLEHLTAVVSYVCVWLPLLDCLDLHVFLLTCVLFVAWTEYLCDTASFSVPVWWWQLV